MTAKEKRELLLPDMVQVWLAVVMLIAIFVAPSLKTGTAWLRAGAPLFAVLLGPLLLFYILRVAQIRSSLGRARR